MIGTVLDGPWLPLLVPIWPLLLAVLVVLAPRLRRNALAVLPLAPLPGLLLALTGSSDQPATQVPSLLLGMTLALDASGLLLLALTALVWLAAGVHALAFMQPPRRPARFAVFWCVTLSGNLGVCLAADAVSFYVAFAMVSLTAYALIVHDGSDAARRAGRLYLGLAVAGEVMLLMGLLLAIAAADSLLLGDLQQALAAPTPTTTLSLLLLIGGCGLKAGLIPLHIWLPIAHPAAPVPASAVLSGAIVIAGIIGLIRCLPDSAAGSGQLLLVLGLLGTWAAALVGLTQARAKTVLAYSTVSQIGLVIATLGAAISLADPELRLAAALYATHHGLAKAALFLAVALFAIYRRGWQRTALLLLSALIAGSIAGLPGTGGALAKAAIKPGFDGWAYWLVSASAVTTTLLFVHWLSRCLQLPAAGTPSSPQRAALITVAVLLPAAVAVALPLWQWSGLTSAPWPTLEQTRLIDGVWPIALAGVIAVVGVVSGAYRRLPRIPEGDLAVLLERGAARLVGALAQPRQPAARAGRTPGRLRRIVQPARRVERLLAPWRARGLLMVVLVLLIALGVAANL